MKIGVASNLDAVERSMVDIGKQTRFASAVALTRTISDVRTAIRDEMPRAFDRPVGYTLNSMFVKGATVSKPEAMVWVKDNPFGNGTPADRYLAPEIYGGTRPQKKFERMLQRAGLLPAGWQVVPGAGADIDANGNMSRGQIVKILSWFRTFGEEGYTKNVTDAGRAKLKRGTKKKLGMEYFVSNGPGTPAARGRIQHLPAGIYARTNRFFGGVRPVMLFVKRSLYRPRLRFFEIGKEVAARNYPMHFDREMANALRTARPSDRDGR